MCQVVKCLTEIRAAFEVCRKAAPAATEDIKVTLWQGQTERERDRAGGGVAAKGRHSIKCILSDS